MYRAALLSLVCLFACAEKQTPARIGTNVWPGYEPLYLAREVGLYERPVRFVEYTSATEVIRSFRNGTIDLAALTLDEVLLLHQEKLSPKIVLVLDSSNGADALLASPPISKMEELKGRRVGVESTALGAYLLTRALQSAGMSVSDIIVVPLEVDEHQQAFQEHKIDAVVTFDPVRADLVRGGAVTLFDSTKIPGEIVDVLVARADYLEKHPEVVRSVISGWFRALDYLKDKPLDAAQKMSAREGVSPESLLRSYALIKLPTLQENTALLSGEGALYQSARALESSMRSSGLLTGDAVIEDLFAPNLLQGVR